MVPNFLCMASGAYVDCIMWAVQPTLCVLDLMNRRIIEEGITKHSVPRHFSIHQENTKGLNLFGIETKHLSERERFSKLCQRETFWIFTLHSMSPGGPNKELGVSTII